MNLFENLQILNEYENILESKNINKNYTIRAKELSKDKAKGEYSIWYRDDNGDHLVYDAELDMKDAKKVVNQLIKEFGRGFSKDIMS